MISIADKLDEVNLPKICPRVLYSDYTMRIIKQFF